MPNQRLKDEALLTSAFDPKRSFKMSQIANLLR